MTVSYPYSREITEGEAGLGAMSVELVLHGLSFKCLGNTGGKFSVGTYGKLPLKRPRASLPDIFRAFSNPLTGGELDQMTHF